MTPLSYLMNCSAHSTQSSSCLKKNFQSRFLMGIAVPFELLTIAENALKLPFQTAACMVKIPAKVVNVLACSASLEEFESSLAGPLDIIKTALKIVGYAIGVLFTASLGIIAPYKNFQLHCLFRLISNQKAQKEAAFSEEKITIANSQKEIYRDDNSIKTIICEVTEKSETTEQQDLTASDQTEQILQTEAEETDNGPITANGPIIIEIDQPTDAKEKQIPEKLAVPTEITDDPVQEIIQTNQQIPDDSSTNGSEIVAPSEEEYLKMRQIVKYEPATAT